MSRRVSAVCVTALVLSAWVAHAQTQKSAAPQATPDAIFKALDVREGNTICEIGAGNGDVSIAAARVVGPTGRIYTSELGESRIKALHDRVTASSLAQITVVTGQATRTGFPDAACDAVFLKDVYHHFTDPGAMNGSIAAALKPGARLLVIDFTPPPGQEASTPADRGKDGMHGIGVESLTHELKTAGFEVVSSEGPVSGINRWFWLVARRSGRLALPAVAEQPIDIDADTAGRFARLALACVQKEYPNKIAHVMNSADDVKAPRELTPAFYGCYDWHSAVHGHWLLVRLARQFPSAPWAADARAALTTNITAKNIAGEVAYLNGKGRETFERPYGLSWLLQLAAELREWQSPEGKQLAATIAPLESAVAARLRGWLVKLAYPIREGEHAQTAFAFGLMIDWGSAYDSAFATLTRERVLEFHRRDRNCPMAYEPSGQDFLSPCLAEADVMRRAMPSAEFATWLTTFLPGIPRDGGTRWLPIGVVTDKTDGKLAHLDGLNLSRAWMLEGIASALPSSDARRRSLLATARVHADSGLDAVTGQHYEGGHWLGSFATYLVTKRGIPQSTVSSHGGTEARRHGGTEETEARR